MDYPMDPAFFSHFGPAPALWSGFPILFSTGELPNGTHASQA